MHLDAWVRKIPLEERMAIHSSILAWRSPWTDHGVAGVRQDCSNLAAAATAYLPFYIFFEILS